MSFPPQQVSSPSQLAGALRRVVAVALVSLLVSDRTSRGDCTPSEECGMSEVQLSDQARDSFERADAELAQVFDAALATTAERAGKATQDAESWKAVCQKAHDAWRTYRDVTCGDLRKQTYWGSSGAASSLAGWDCLDSMTRARIAELKDYVY